MARGNCRQHQHGLQERKAIPDANPGTPAKGEVGIFRQPLGLAFGPALRLELVWLIEETRVALHNPLAHHHDRACRYGKATYRPVLQRSARKSIDGWIEAHRLHDYTLGKCEPWQIRKRWRS